MRVLFIEDSPRILNAVSKALKKEHYVVDTASRGDEGLWLAMNHTYDAIILDIMLPEMSGMEVLNALRKQGSGVNILMLTAKDSIHDRVKGLKEGADDYLTKPFAIEELLARVEVMCRRTPSRKVNLLHVGCLSLDIGKKEIFCHGEKLILSAKEYRITECLMVHADSVVSRTEIEDHIYDAEAEPMSNVVDVSISSLRRKLKALKSDVGIQTRRGFGYILCIQS